MIKRILLGLGGTPFTDVAIERAVELEKTHDAFITGGDRREHQATKTGRICSPGRRGLCRKASRTASYYH